MTKLGVQVPETIIVSLEKRAARLASLVESATQASPERPIREGGALLIDRLGEWVEEIKDLREMGDEEVTEVIRSFATRLRIAEEKVKAWPLPQSARKHAMRQDRLRRKPRAKRPVKDAA